jgi:hypothetical protein
LELGTGGRERRGEDTGDRQREEDAVQGLRLLGRYEDGMLPVAMGVL